MDLFATNPCSIEAWHPTGYLAQLLSEAQQCFVVRIEVDAFAAQCFVVDFTIDPLCIKA